MQLKDEQNNCEEFMTKHCKKIWKDLYARNKTIMNISWLFIADCKNKRQTDKLPDYWRIIVTNFK